MDYQDNVILITDSQVTTPSPKRHGITSPTTLEASIECLFYTAYQQERLESLISPLMENPNQSCIVDLVNFLDHCVAQCVRLTHANILAILRLTSVLQSVRVVNKLHFILRQDLRLGSEPRPHSCSPELMDGLNVHLNSGLQLLRRVGEPVNHLKYHALRLTLNYFVKVLTSSHLSSVSVNKTTKWPFFSKIIQMIILVAKNTNIQGLVITYNELLDDLFLLFCVPLSLKSSSHEVAQSIAFAFEEQLRGVESLDVRRHLLQLIPSMLLKEIVLDMHLENEFKYHRSDVTGIQTSQDEPMSLNKFCWIHLCRMPYYPNGSLHDLSFFLYLLYSLLESHLLLVTNQSSQPTHDLSVVLDSLKPHVAGLVDRLSEDEVLLARLVTPCCWGDIQKLSSVIDTVIASLAM